MFHTGAKSALLALSILSSSLVWANNGPYFSLGVGYGTIENSDLQGGDLGRSIAKVGLGYQFVDQFALEFNGQYYTPATSSSYIDLKTEAYVFGLLAVAKLPLTPQLRLVGKVGPGYSYVKNSLLHSYYSNIAEQGVSVSYAAGIEIDLSPSFGASLEYLGTSIFVDKTDSDNMFNFDVYNKQLNSVMGNLIWRF